MGTSNGVSISSIPSCTCVDDCVDTTGERVMEIGTMEEVESDRVDTWTTLDQDGFLYPPHHRPHGFVRPAVRPRWTFVADTEDGGVIYKDGELGLVRVDQDEHPADCVETVREKRSSPKGEIV